MGSNCQSAPFPGHTLNSSKSLVKSCGIIILPTGSGPAYFQWSQHAPNADSPWKFYYMNRGKIEGRNSLALEFRYLDVSISFDINCSVDFYSHEPISSVLFYGCTMQHLLLFSQQVISDSLHPQGLQHIRPPCPSPSPRVCPSSYPLNQWCHPTISSSVALFPCFQSFPASGFFPGKDGEACGNLNSLTRDQPMPLTLEGIVLTTGLPGKSLLNSVMKVWEWIFSVPSGPKLQ